MLQKEIWRRALKLANLNKFTQPSNNLNFILAISLHERNSSKRDGNNWQIKKTQKNKQT